MFSPLQNEIVESVVKSVKSRTAQGVGGVVSFLTQLVWERLCVHDPSKVYMKNDNFS